MSTAGGSSSDALNASTGPSNFSLGTTSGSTASTDLGDLLNGVPGDIDKGTVIAGISCNFICLILVFYCLYVFIKYMTMANPKTADRKKLVIALKVHLIKSGLLRNIVVIIMIYTGSPTLWLLGIVILAVNVPFFCCMPACWYMSFKNW
jgi:hypothetical protein